MNRPLLTIAILSSVAGMPATAAAQSIRLSGTAKTNVQQGLDTLGVSYTNDVANWAAPDSADIIIVVNDGGAAGPDYTGHLAAGRHLLVVGGSLGAFQRKVGDHHGVTCCEQAVGDGEAEALGSAGDQCNLVHGGALTGCSQYPRGYRWS